MINFIGVDQEQFEKWQKMLAEIKEEVISLKKQKSLGDVFLDIADVCKMLKISKRLLYEWRKSGRLRHYAVSGKIYFKASEIISYLESHEIKSFRK